MKLLINNDVFELPELSPSLEGVSEDGVEREYVFYGQMVDKSDLDRATSFSDQEQYRIFLPTKEKDREITARIRKSIWWERTKEGELFASNPEYHLTIKSFLKGEKGCLETECSLESEQGAKLLEVFRAADPTGGMIKRRYVFPVGTGYFPDNPDPNERVGMRGVYNDMIWEVDVPKEFRDPKSLDRSEVEDGNCWVKLDLEVKQFRWKLTDDQFQMPFPIRLTNVIYRQPGERDKETEAKVKNAMKAFRVDAPKPSTEAVHVNVNINSDAGIDYSDPKTVVIGTLTVWAALWAIGKGIQGIKKLFSKKRRKAGDREDDIKELSAAKREEDRIRTTIRSTFLNGNWLDKHRMEMRGVSGKGIVGQLSLNGRFPVTAQAVTAAVRGELQEVKRVIQYLKSKGKAKDDDSYLDFSLEWQRLLGDVIWKKEDRELEITYRSTADTIQPLSKIDVPNIADLVLECLDVYVELEAIASNPKRQNKMHVEWVLADSLLETMQALMHWMGRSVKQTSVSTESVKPAMEDAATWIALGITVAIGVGLVAAVKGVMKGIEWLYKKGASKLTAKQTQALQKSIRDNVEEAISSIESTYLTKEWLADARMETKPISGEGIGTRLVKDGVYLKGGLRNAVEQHIRAVDGVADYYSRAIAPWARKVEALEDWMKTEAAKLPDPSDCTAFLQEANRKVKALGSPWEKIPLNGKALIGNPDVSLDGDDNSAYWDYKDTATVTPLTREEVGDVARTLVLVLKAIRTCGEKFKTVPSIADGTELVPDEVWQEMLDYEPLGNVFWHSDRENWYETLEWCLMESLIQIAEALQKLLTRSVLKKV